MPYTIEVFFDSMAQYNRAWFPAAVLGTPMALASLVLALFPIAGHERMSARLVGGFMGVAWIWVGAVHQLQHMATLNFMAPIYGWLWVAQGALIALTCSVLGHVRFHFGRDVRGRIGLVFGVFGLVGYPLVVLLLGYGWRTLPLVGTAPDPTAIFTAGLLIAARERPPLYLFVVPLGWALVAAASAFLLSFPLDYAVPAAILVAAALAIRAHMRRPSVSTT